MSLASSKSRCLLHAVNKLLLHCKTYLAVLRQFSSFANFIFFISKLPISLDNNISTSFPHSSFPPTAQQHHNFPCSRPASASEISKILFSCSNIQSGSDLYPSGFWKMCLSSVLISTVTNIVNLTLTSSQLHLFSNNLLSLHFSTATANFLRFWHIRKISTRFLN